MGKKAKKAAPVPRAMTKRQLSKYERDRKLNSIAKIGVVAVSVLLVLVVAFGYYREVMAKPGEAVAKVDGKEINLGNFAKVLGYNDINLDFQRAQLQDLLSRSASGDPSLDFTRQYAQQNLQQLEFRKRLLPSEVLDEMIDSELIRQEVARRGLDVSSNEVDDFLVRQYSSTSTTSPTTVDASGTLTEELTTEATAPMTKTIAEVNEEIRQALTQTNFLTMDEYRRFIVEPYVYREKLQEAMSAEVATSGEQVHARHILVETEDQARDVLRMLKDEGLSFDSVAQQMSTDSSNKDKGGDLGWFSRGMMTKAFEDVAFSLPVGELSEPVNTEFGFHIIKVDERADDSPFSEEQLNQLRASAFSKWLNDQKQPEAKRVEQLDSPERIKWANDWVSSKRKEMAKRAPVPKL